MHAFDRLAARSASADVGDVGWWELFRRADEFPRDDRVPAATGRPDSELVHAAGGAE